VSAAEPVPAAPPAAEPEAPRPRRSPRAWFRARLERDPRRWVLVLAALEGLATVSLNLQANRELIYSKGGGVAVLLGFVAVVPATGVLAMLAHGRVLLWTGKLLGGRAVAHEIHAAYAWAQVPLVLAATPLVLEIPLRAALAEADPVPRWLSGAVRGLDGAADPLLGLAILGAFAAGLLYVRFLAEAQRFSSWRAVANHVLAAVLGLGLTALGVFVASRLMPGSAPYQFFPLSLVVAVVPALIVERLVVIARRSRPRRSGP